MNTCPCRLQALLRPPRRSAKNPSWWTTAPVAVLPIITSAPDVMRIAPALLTPGAPAVRRVELSPLGNSAGSFS